MERIILSAFGNLVIVAGIMLLFAPAEFPREVAVIVAAFGAAIVAISGKLFKGRN